MVEDVAVEVGALLEPGYDPGGVLLAEMPVQHRAAQVAVHQERPLAVPGEAGREVARYERLALARESCS